MRRDQRRNKYMNNIVPGDDTLTLNELTCLYWRAVTSVRADEALMETD